MRSQDGIIRLTAFCLGFGVAQLVCAVFGLGRGWLALAVLVFGGIAGLGALQLLDYMANRSWEKSLGPPPKFNSSDGTRPDR